MSAPPASTPPVDSLPKVAARPSRRHQPVRPPDLIYGLDDRPPLGHLILLGAQHGGLGLVCGMIAFAGGVEAIFAWALPRMRRVFPPVVSGFIVIAVGVELGLIGVRGFL